MDPSQILEHSRAEHRALREAALELEKQVRRCDCSSLPAPIARAIHSLLERMRDHLEKEDEQLDPMLGSIDAWGPLRIARKAERRGAELRRLGEMLSRLAEPLHEGPLRSHVFEFIDWLDDELAAEEEQLVNERVLRDDPIIDDTCGG